jgi:hypothetical protein
MEHALHTKTYCVGRRNGRAKKFTLFPIGGLLKDLWALPKVADWLKYGFKYVTDGLLRDFQDGAIWQEIISSADFDEYTAVVSIVTDPIQATKAKHGRSHKIVPILGIIMDEVARAVQGFRAQSKAVHGARCPIRCRQTSDMKIVRPYA